MTATLLLHWELDTATDGATLVDVSGAGRGGVVDGSATAGPDPRFGSCLTPATGTVLRSRNDDTALRSRTATFAVWADLQRPPAGRTAVVGGRAGGPTLGVTSAGAVILLAGDTRIGSSDGVVKFAGWQHLAVTDDGTQLQAFVDGTAVTRGASTAASGPGRVVLGAHAGGAGGALVLDLTTTARAGSTTTALATAGAVATANQRWSLTADGCVTSGANPAQVLDVMGGAYTNGTPVVVWPRSSPVSGNQRWTLAATGQLVSGNPAYVLDANGGGVTPGAAAALWSRNSPDSANQVWARDADGRLRTGVVAAVGRFAHLRLYDGVLDADALRRDMADDESALAAFVRGHPLTAELTNATGQPVLYIDDSGAAQRLTLRVTNSSRQDMELRALSAGAVGADRCHVAVCLRPGTLAASARPALGAAGWTLVADPSGSALYLAANTPTTLLRGAWIDLPIDGLNADGTGGTRGTRVEVAFAHVGYAGETQELTASRLLFLDVVNHRGRPDIPLHAALVGGDRVLTDGKTLSTLKIRLSTVSRDVGLALAGATTAGGTAAPAPSSFVVSFEGQEGSETREWALTAAGQAGAVTLTTKGPDTAQWRQVSDDLGQRRSWRLTPAADTTIAPGAGVVLTLDAIVALPVPGTATIVVAYRNVPGYQDGFIPVTVARGPLLYGATAVGIGTAAGASALTVGADSGHLQLRRSTDAAGDGNKVYLELFQDQRPANHDVYPSIRFHHANRFWNRIEGRSEGVMMKFGDPGLDSFVDLYAATGRFTGLKVGGVPTGNAIGARAHVSADSEHLQLRRSTTAAGAGSQVYLELFQDAPAQSDVYPAIRFQHAGRFSSRIEGRPEGISFRVGDTSSDALIDVFARDVFARTAALNGLYVGGTPSGGNGYGLATVRGDANHLQLRRESTAAGRGPQIYLELYQDALADGQVVNPAIRFHQSNKFWHRMEAGPDGFAFRFGDPGQSTLTNVYAGTAVVNNLRIGGQTIGENELRILNLLASGQLKIDLRNTAQNEYAYAADFSPFDNDRRHVFTWRHKGERVSQGEWQLESPR